MVCCEGEARVVVGGRRPGAAGGGRPGGYIERDHGQGRARRHRSRTTVPRARETPT